MEVHTFPEAISSKMSTIVRLEFELVYYDVVVQYVSPYDAGTNPRIVKNARII